MHFCGSLPCLFKGLALQIEISRKQRLLAKVGQSFNITAYKRKLDILS
jgi:hypothetical protein